MFDSLLTKPIIIAGKSAIQKKFFHRKLLIIFNGDSGFLIVSSFFCFTNKKLTINQKISIINHAKKGSLISILDNSGSNAIIAIETNDIFPLILDIILVYFFSFPREVSVSCIKAESVPDAKAYQLDHNICHIMNTQKFQLSRKQMVESALTIFETIRVSLCHRLSAIYELGISKRNEVIYEAVAKIHNCHIEFQGNIKK